MYCSAICKISKYSTVSGNLHQFVSTPGMCMCNTRYEWSLRHDSFTIETLDGIDCKVYVARVDSTVVNTSESLMQSRLDIRWPKYLEIMTIIIIYIK